MSYIEARVSQARALMQMQNNSSHFTLIGYDNRSSHQIINLDSFNCWNAHIEAKDQVNF